MKKQTKENGAENLPAGELIVACIGASAGGLEALQEFFKVMPVETGIAFVVIQHLSPDYKSLMDELLARYTKIPIQIIRDGLKVEPDNIYLIPPRKHVSIFHDQLFLEDQNPGKGLNLPIDIFFQSLAKEKGKNAIGVVLSGTGSDGTLGTRAIKEAGGMIMVQDEMSAKFDGMPRSAIATGLVDYILPASKIPEALLDYIKHPFVRKSNSLENILSKNLDALTKITLILRDFSGLDFSYYKENTIIRRLERRVSINRFETLEQYVLFLSESNKEKETLYREMLIGVTRFFRDQEAFQALEKKVFPELITKNKKSLRIWSTASSTGEEVYSIAIVVAEYIAKNNLDVDVKIFATDIDRHALDIAGQGFYSDSVLADVDPVYLTKYFVRRENGYQVNESIRKMVVFAAHNLIKDPPFSKLDMLICRNLFIYLKPEMQARILATFYYSLNPGGILFMGSSESIGEMNDAFEPVDAKWKIYRYKSGYKTAAIRDMPMLRSPLGDVELSTSLYPRIAARPKLDKLFEAALASVLPPSIILDDNETIISVINDVSQFTKIQPGVFSQNVFSILPEELSLFVNNLLRRLKKERGNVVFENISGIKGFGDAQITIAGRTIESCKTTFYIISFVVQNKEKRLLATEKSEPIDVEMHVANRVGELEKELQMTRESLQATVEELETSNEELQSSNEELIASNEELQSTNEELQSVNEELYTVNSEYQIKIEELTRLNSDLDNLLKNTEVGAIYLDRNLCIRKITAAVSRITKILSSDIGRPLSHLSVLDRYPDLQNDVNQVLDNLQSLDREVVGDNGIAYSLRIRPYRTANNAMEGLLLTFVDVSKLKAEHQRADEAADHLKMASEIGTLAWWEWNVQSGKVIYDNLRATMLGYTPQEFPDNIYRINDLIHPDDHHAVMRTMTDYMHGKIPAYDITYRIRRKDNSYGWCYDRGEIRQRNESGEPLIVSGAVIDITKMKLLEQDLCQSRDLFQKVLENSPLGKIMVDAEGNITYLNRRAEDILGVTVEDTENGALKMGGWRMTDSEGLAIPLSKNPFSIVRESRQPLYDYRYCLTAPPDKELWLSINGAPVQNADNAFEGAVFTIGVIDEK